MYLIIFLWPVISRAQYNGQNIFFLSGSTTNGWVTNHIFLDFRECDNMEFKMLHANLFSFFFSPGNGKLFFKGKILCIVGFADHTVCHNIELCYSSMKSAKTICKQMSTVVLQKNFIHRSVGHSLPIFDLTVTHTHSRCYYISDFLWTWVI